jgi:DNA repair exonuclease SbcCD nuclease subunit
MNIEAKRAFIVSDSHFGARSNSVEWLDEMMDWFENDFILRVKSEYRPGDVLIHCGDVFDNRQSVNLLVLHRAITLFEKLSEIFVDGIYIIAGNHDVMRKTSNDVSSLDCLKYIPKVNIIKEPAISLICGKNVLFMPWRTNDEEERKCIETFSDRKLDYLFCHTNIRNLRFDSRRDVEEGLLLEDIKSFQRVYSGHIHWSQHRGNVTMVGNPYQMTRSDAGNQKGFYLLDFESNEETFFENNYSPKFVRIYLNKYIEKTVEELKRDCHHNRVDLYVPSNYLMKYQINPIIDILSEITKKLEVIPYEADLYEDEAEGSLSDEGSFNIISLCERYITSIKSFESETREKIMSKINSIYQETIKHEKQ